MVLGNAKQPLKAVTMCWLVCYLRIFLKLTARVDPGKIVRYLGVIWKCLWVNWSGYAVSCF